MFDSVFCFTVSHKGSISEKPSGPFKLSKKPRRVCAAHGANKVKIIFSGGVYVGENTFRPASVEFLR